MEEIQPPNKIRYKFFTPTIFLAGSIEMGKAEDWQRKVIDALSEFNYRILNPRRNDWDSSWKQSIDEPKFKEQVEWELKGLEMSDAIIMYLAPGTMSPISLLELGLHARSKKVVVLCPEGFWRKGNVDVVCEMYKIKQVSTMEELINEFKI